MAVGVPACFTMLPRISASFVSPGSEGFPRVFHGPGCPEPGRFRMKFVCAKSAAELKCSQFPACGGSMRRTPWLIGIFFLVGCSANAALAQQIGKIVPVQAGSDADHAISEINAATDPARKLALIGTFAEGAGKEGDYPILANGLYVDYYLAQKNYDKAFEYGDQLFALDQDNFQNAMNMVRAASEK